MSATASASQVEKAAELNLPIVDISGLRGASASERSKVATAIRQACLDKGFFYCVGHGVAASTMQRLFDASAEFFALPMDRKLDVAMSRSKANRGYEPLRGQTLEAGAPPDLKEGYYIGRDVPADDEQALKYFNTGPNVWPAGLAGFEAVTSAYFAEMRSLAGVLLEGIALSLGLDADFFTTLEQDPIATLRLLHYPPQAANPHPDEKGCGAHTDFGGITILLQDNVGGLQVWDHDQSLWLDAVPVPGAFVINLGDLIARWTNDTYRSTRHRVINASGQERYSAPFFFCGNPAQRIECIQSCLEPGEGAKYAAVTVDEHMRERYAATYKRSFD
ncbi:isopenicillin N synthase family dioxygenase [Sphingobium rhizovicinum]|jgi:isopenicillin N synthase-like dioxygenase|uniref:2-oxoglutarate-dependent ethylene/succinate-forming enzyme n=2 Tax=Sphingobium TaxID=165695 RepID=A0ABV7NMF5_9SPHN|nr:2OG-Fe(II) oxygenase [Sphingomonas paucimobilis]PHP17681.1 oxidoreductase [Sphingobium sp. IP1]